MQSLNHSSSKKTPWRGGESRRWRKGGFAFINIFIGFCRHLAHEFRRLARHLKLNGTKCTLVNWSSWCCTTFVDQFWIFTFLSKWLLMTSLKKNSLDNISLFFLVKSCIRSEDSRCLLLHCRSPALRSIWKSLKRSQDVRDLKSELESGRSPKFFLKTMKTVERRIEADSTLKWSLGA